MPTPDCVRERARKRRERVCPICGAQFLASRPSAKGFCSRSCQDENFKRVMVGRKHTEETKLKMSESGKAWRVKHPEWEKRRREAAYAATQTDEYIAGALARYKAMNEGGTGICSNEIKALTASAGKWVMKRARAALEAETDFNEVWTRVQERLRREMPYDGPLGSADNFEYLQKLGRAVTADEEVRALHDGFMREAIPRFYAEWKILQATKGDK